MDAKTDNLKKQAAACQADGARRSSRPTVPLPLYRVFWYLKTEGVGPTLRRALWHLELRVRGRTPAAVQQDEPLNLQPGEWVEIKSEQEILQTLDESGVNRGMQFMPQMRRYCGTRARVFKRLENVLFEESQQRRRIRNTVLLEGLICDGEGVGCDRSCFFFWRETWLKRAPSPERT